MLRSCLSNGLVLHIVLTSLHLSALDRIVQEKLLRLFFIQVNIGKIMYLNCGEKCEDMIDYHSGFIHNLRWLEPVSSTFQDVASF